LDQVFDIHIPITFFRTRAGHRPAMSKVIVFVVLASVVKCRRSLQRQSPDASALRTLLLASQSVRPLARGHSPRHHVGKMEESTEKEKVKPKIKEETPSGLFGPLVLAVRDVAGEQELQKVRAQVIKEHSNVINGFVATSESQFGQNVMKRMFEIADKDGNGSLDREEIREAMKSLGFVKTDDKMIDKIMSKSDADGNDVIDYDEFVKGAPPVLKYQLTQLAKANGHDLGFLVNLKKALNGDAKEGSNELFSDEVQENLNELGYFLMRLFVAAMMIHHGQEKLLDAASFTKYTLDVQFKFLPGPHLYWTYLIGSIQWLGPMFMTLGIFTRIAGASLTGVMVGAVLQSLLGGGLEGFPFFELGGLGAKMPFMVPSYHNYGFETPLLYVAVFLMVAIKGPGKFSLSQLLGWNDDNSLFGKIKQ